MTFCAASEHSSTCRRQLTDDDLRAAIQWWGGPDAPIAFADFCGSGDDLQAAVEAVYARMRYLLPQQSPGLGSTEHDSDRPDACWCPCCAD